MRTGGPMAFLSGRRAHAGAAFLLVVWGLALLGRMATAQSDMCYPKPGKRSPLKKGACFMVTHTTEAFFGRDVVSMGCVCSHWCLGEEGGGKGQASGWCAPP